MNQNAISEVSCKLCRNDQVKFLYQSRRYGFHVGQCPRLVQFMLDFKIKEALGLLHCSLACLTALVVYG